MGKRDVIAHRMAEDKNGKMLIEVEFLCGVTKGRQRRFKGGGPWIVSEFVPGGALDKLLYKEEWEPSLDHVL